VDPITHTLAGAALARTRLGRPHAEAPLDGSAATSRGWTGAALMIGANLPDVDAVCYFVGSDFALAHRRGWTHGALAMVVLPIVLALLVAGTGRLVERLRKRPSPGLPPFRRLLLLSAVGVWSHPLLDWLNTYGVRFLAPSRRGARRRRRTTTATSRNPTSCRSSLPASSSTRSGRRFPNRPRRGSAVSSRHSTSSARPCS
jgi:membrane-bound metal-dependent hydrolase YbcI (DUF457 family)